MIGAFLRPRPKQNAAALRPAVRKGSAGLSTFSQRTEQVVGKHGHIAFAPRLFRELLSLR